MQVNVLAYMETLCIDTGAANQLVSSSLAIHFVRMLRTSRAPALRVRLASVLGLLVRHATVIADALGQSGQLFLPQLQVLHNDASGRPGPSGFRASLQDSQFS